MVRLLLAALILSVIQMTAQGDKSVLAGGTDIAGAKPWATGDLSLNTQDEAYSKIIKVLSRAGIKTYLNREACLKNQIVGTYNPTISAIILCTKRMKVFADDSREYEDLLGSTIAHEAIHVAQYCRSRNLGIPYLGVSAGALYALPESVQSDIKKSMKVANYSTPRSVAWRIEAEAYYHERRPEEVIQHINSNCLP